MATTVEQMIKKSLKEIVVAGAEQSVPAIEAQDYIFALNNYVADLESDSTVDLTYTTVTSVSDTLGVPDGIIRALAAVMAVEVCDEYGVEVSPTLARKALNGENHILNVCTTRTGAYKPATLPLGSGNESYASISERFYSGSE